MSEPNEFSLHGVVMAVLGESDEPDPGRLAAVVLQRIPTRHYRAVLEQLLRGYVRDVAGQIRRSIITPMPAESASKAPAANPSWKVTAWQQTDWRAKLHARIHIDSSGEWKFMKDMSAADFVSAAEERRRLAAQDVAWAERYEAYAKLLVDHGADTFAALPEDVQREALT